VGDSPMKVAALPVIALVGLLAGLAVTAYPAHGQQPNCGYYRNSNGHEVPRPCGNWRASPGQPRPTVRQPCAAMGPTATANTPTQAAPVPTTASSCSTFSSGRPRRTCRVSE
jgi:hypothetical protein